MSRHKDRDLQSIIRLAVGNCGSSSSDVEVGSSPVYRQGMVIPAAGKLGQKDLFRPKSEEDDSSITRDAEHEILQLSIRREGISLCTEETGKSFNKFCVLSGVLQDQRISMGIIHDFVDEGSHPSWTRCPG